jgi:protein gp37
MSNQSEIEWTEQTWNPTAGCTKVSPGCKHCYAEKMAKRLQAMGTPGYENGFRLSLVPERLAQPLRRRQPTLYFVNSMSDLFHEDIPYSYLDQIFDVVSLTPQHTYQVLTKRAERLAAYSHRKKLPGNLWLGVSVEDRSHGLPRIDALRLVSATVRFVSAEPLLEDLGDIDLDGIHWVIVGGESGPQARPMQPEWVDNIKRRCDEAGTAFFFKQWGGWGADGRRRSKRANGRIYLGQTWDAMPNADGLRNQS